MACLSMACRGVPCSCHPSSNALILHSPCPLLCRRRALCVWGGAAPLCSGAPCHPHLLFQQGTGCFAHVAFKSAAVYGTCQTRCCLSTMWALPGGHAAPTLAITHLLRLACGRSACLILQAYGMMGWRQGYIAYPEDGSGALAAQVPHACLVLSCLTAWHQPRRAQLHESETMHS